MDVKIFLSTDGKHTVEVDSVDEDAEKARELAEEIYDKIYVRYGTKQAQAAKAYAAKPASSTTTEDPAWVEGSEVAPVCPKHPGKPMTLGKWGWFCKTPDPTQLKGWCTYKPPKGI